MKEIKEFIQELCDCAKPSANGSVVALEDATRIVAHAFAGGMVRQKDAKKNLTKP